LLKGCVEVLVMRSSASGGVVLLLVGVGVGVTALACTPADPYGQRPTIDSDGTSTNSKSDCSSAAAGKPIEGKDPSSLPSCKGTKGVSGRCVARSELGSFAETFEKGDCKADTEGCVPDQVIKDGSAIQLKTCKSIGDVDGRCFWPLAKQIVESYDILKGSTKDQCDADMVCAPCVHPLTKEKTGVCDTGSGGAKCEEKKDTTGAGGKTATCPQVEPIIDTKDMPQEDCGSNMICVDAGLVGDQAARLKKCAKGVCAPKKAVERGGNYVPNSCKSTNGAEGRCTNIGIPQINEQKDLLPKDTCDADERCAPCFDPRDGKETGACRTASCDQPKEPAKTFAQCCGGRARCVPTTAVDAKSAEMLAKDSCSGDTPLCAPVEFVQADAPIRQCKTVLGLVGGICLSKCAIENTFENLVQGDCPEGDMCAPCRSLPAGTKGCPAK